MAYMTTVSDDLAISGEYSVNNHVSSSKSIAASDLLIQNESGSFVMQNSVNLNAPQPLRNDNDISSSGQLIPNQETHFLPDYGSDYTTNVPVFHDGVPPLRAENQPGDFTILPDGETNGFYSNSSQPIKTETSLDSDINAFLTKTSVSKESKLKQDIDNFVKMNSKAADRRMSEDIKAFLRRCRSPSPIESAKSLFSKGPAKSTHTKTSRTPGKARPLSPIDTNATSAGRRSRSRTSKPRSIASHRSSLDSKKDLKPLPHLRSKSPLDGRKPTAYSKSKISPDRRKSLGYRRSISPDMKRPLPLAYSRSKSPSNNGKPRAFSRSSSPGETKPLPRAYSKAKSPSEKKSRPYSRSRSPDDKKPLPRAYSRAKSPSERKPRSHSRSRSPDDIKPLPRAYSRAKSPSEKRPRAASSSRSPKDIKPLPRAYSRAKSPSEKKPRAASRSRSPEDIKPLPRAYSRAKSPSEKKSRSSSRSRSPDDKKPLPRAYSKARSPSEKKRPLPYSRQRSPSHKITESSKSRPLPYSRKKSPPDRPLPYSRPKSPSSKVSESSKTRPLPYSRPKSSPERSLPNSRPKSPYDRPLPYSRPKSSPDRPLPYSRPKDPLDEGSDSSKASDSRMSRAKSFGKDSRGFQNAKSVYQRRDRSLEELKSYEQKLQSLAKLKPEEIIELEKKIWTKSELLPLYYTRQKSNKAVCEATPKLLALCDKFERKVIKLPEKIRASQPPYDPPYAKKKKPRTCCHRRDSSSSCSSEEDEEDDDSAAKVLKLKHTHPLSLHEELWFNDPGQMNDGVLCRCSAKAARSGIRHGIYQGETNIKPCNPNTNNLDRLYHYRITLSPPTNFLTKMPTLIEHDDHEYIFEGFSMFTHEPLGELPTCKVIRFNINYAILYIEEEKPENFVIRELDLFYKYVFNELLELVDFSVKPSVATGDTCPLFHFMPRFVRELPENGKEILGMGNVINYLLKSYKMVIPHSEVPRLNNLSTFDWQNEVLKYKGMIVTYPGAKPSSIRVDQLNRDDEKDIHPEVVHFGIRPPQLSYAGNPEYQKAWRAYVKYRHLIANMPKPSYDDKRALEKKETRLLLMRTQSKMKRGVTVTVSSENFYSTGIMCDVVQHAMLLPVLVCHLRFHRSLQILEETIGYKFKNRYLLQLAMTHPSFRENFGTNPDHARNSLTNCGIRQPEYGDRRIHYMNTRKRGINTLINIMSRFGKKSETESNITHNERLEFLGDAVVEFITSIHLYHMFPDLEEGGLATYRAAIVQNQHLAVLAKVLNLQDYMLYAHGSDLCHELELRHAMANCFEALMGALFLDGGIEVPDKVFGNILFKDDPELLDVWVNYPPHPLQQQEPNNDRHWIPSFPLLQKLTKFEESIGVEFNHIRLLARAFTDRSVGYTNLTLGSNQRMEFLGDTVLQLIASDYLYKYFPEHHEGHLSLLRSSLVNNRTQSVVCDDLNIPAYALYSNPKAELKTKDRADLLESFLGALYIDKGLEFCRVFCDVCFFPRLQDFIMHQDWNDPKSKLQQCCLTLRTLDGGEPDIPIYKVIECKGPTNSRIYTVAVYFRRQRLAEASGHSIQQAEMNAANNALEQAQGLFPQLDHQKRVIAKSMIYNNRAANAKFQPNQNGRFGQRQNIRDRFKRNNFANNMRARRVNKQLGAKAVTENKTPKAAVPRSVVSRPVKQNEVKKKFEPEKPLDKTKARSQSVRRSEDDKVDSRKSESRQKIDEEDEFESTIKFHTMKEKLNRQIAKEWEEELAETERKEKIRKKISKIKNLGSKAVRKSEKLKKKQSILKLKRKLKLKLKEKKLLKAKQKEQQKLRKVLVSADKLKRRLQMREKILERQAYEVELKRKMLEENLKKQNNKLDVERMRMILKGGSAPAPAPSTDEQNNTEVGEVSTKIEIPDSSSGHLKPELPKAESKLEKPSKKSETQVKQEKVEKEVQPKTVENSKDSVDTHPKSSGKSEIPNSVKDDENDELSPIDSDSSLGSFDEKEVNENGTDVLNPASPTEQKMLKLQTLLNDLDKDNIAIKDKIEKRRRKLKKKRSSKDHDKSTSHDSDRKSVFSKSSKSTRALSSDLSSVESSPSSHHKRSQLESEYSKKRKSRKREKSLPKKHGKAKRSITPVRHEKLLRSPSPVKRKRRESEKSSSRKLKSKVRSELHESVRSRKRRSRSRSSHRQERKRTSASVSPGRSHKKRESRSLSLSLSPPGKRYRTSKSRSRSPGRYYNHRRSRSRSPSDKYSRKSKSSRADRDEYLKYMLNMSQSVCPGCTAGTCQMSSSHLVTPPNPHMPPLRAPPPMAYRPPGPPGPHPHGPPPMYSRYPPPGPMRGPPPVRPHRFAVRGPMPPGAQTFVPGPPMGPRPGPFRPPFHPGAPPPAGPYYPPPGAAPYPAAPDPNYSGPPNYWT